jgi:hypothetical protein
MRQTYSGPPEAGRVPGVDPGADSRSNFEVYQRALHEQPVVL